MVTNGNIEFTKFQVEQLEIFADTLEGFNYATDDLETKFLILILNIESLLPKSNIFEYVFKTDIKKEEKLDLETTRKEKFETINSNVDQLIQLPNEIDLKYAEIRRIEQEIQDIHSKMDNMGMENQTLYNEVEEIDNKVSEIENFIDESEWKVELDSHEEMTFNNIKQKLVIEKRLNYGNI